MLLFVVAVGLILLLTNVLMVALLLPQISDSPAPQSWQQLGAQLSSSNGMVLTLALLMVIATVIMIKWLALRGGGRKIAESIGGKRIQTNSQEFKQRQLLNVVEEMALAAGIAVPPVYLLADEHGINAFAAGHTPKDAVIGITQGALEQLSRGQLQGVIAHEFSHILNGDMRLNMRLIAVLSGIVVISHAGDLLLRTSGGRKNGNQAMLLGLALLALGWIGALFANLIKAAVNRQREYLADAAAVQFTRDPSTIAGALKMIAVSSGHSYLESANAAQSSHMLFSSYRAFSSLLASHPPIDKRIRAIEPNWNGRYAATVIKTQQRQQPVQQATAPEPKPAAHQANATAVIGAVLLAQLPNTLQQQAREPADVTQLALALIGDSTSRVAATISALTLKSQLTLLQLLLPTLTALSDRQQQQLLEQLQRCWQQQSITLSRWCIYQLLLHYLNAPDTHAPLIQATPKRNSASCHLLSLLACHGNDDPQQQQRAFYRGSNSLGWYQAKFDPNVSWPQAAADLITLRRTPPAKKQRLLLAFRQCAEQDGVINDDETALLHCLDLLLDAPAPQ